jgi:hypothetical protein
MLGGSFGLGRCHRFFTETVAGTPSSNANEKRVQKEIEGAELEVVEGDYAYHWSPSNEATSRSHSLKAPKCQQYVGKY